MPVIIIDPENGSGGSGTGDVIKSGTLTTDEIITGGGTNVVKASGVAITGLSSIIETNFINGFDLQTPTSLGTLGWVDATRTFSIAVQGGESNFYFWANGTKITKTTTQSVVVPDVTGTYYIYFDNSGVLQAVEESVMPLSVIYENAITGLIYWNKTQAAAFVGSEQHGIRMSASTHAYNHLTIHARFDDTDGIVDINGLTNLGTTYTGTTSGHFWDEDIRHTIAAQSTHPFLYRLGTTGEWTQTTVSNLVNYKDGADTYFSWNEDTGSTWQLTEGGSATDYWIVFYILTPDISGQTVKKLIGQNAYSSRNNARDAIYTERQNIKTAGLPSPEFVWLYATIVKRDGTIQTLDDGSMYLDFRFELGGGSGTSDAAASQWVLWGGAAYDSTSAIDSATHLDLGTPVSFDISGITYYSQIKSIALDVHTIAGAPCAVGATNFKYSTTLQVQTSDPYTFPLTWSSPATSQMLEDIKVVIGGKLFKGRKIAILGFSAIQKTNDTGANQPRVNMTIDGNALSTANSNAGIEPGTTLSDTGIAINTSNYIAEFGDIFEFSTDANGSNNDAYQLVVTYHWIEI